MPNPWGKIVTHTDFDGVVSAAICSFSLGIEDVVFTGPLGIGQNRVPISNRDVVCDLPYPLECGLWFDHHPGNLDELILRGYDPEQVPGRFELKDSCSRVVFEYFSARVEFPSYLETTVHHADIIDAFRYEDVEDWRRETPAKVVDCALKMAGPGKKGGPFRRRLVFLLRDNPLDCVAIKPDIRAQYQAYVGQEERMLGIIREASYFMPADKDQKLVIIDLMRYKRRPSIVKNLAFVLYPSSQAVAEVRSLYDQGVKTNNFGLSISLSPNVDPVALNKDVGDIMRSLNIGDGHRGAAGGTVTCRSKDEMVKKKREILERIWLLWESL